MNTKHIKAYAPKARADFIQAVQKRLNLLGIQADKKGALTIIEPQINGSVMQINGQLFDAANHQAWLRLKRKAEQIGFDVLLEQVAYTWFNRFCAIRYMELHDYFEHGLRVLSHPDKPQGFQILDQAQDVALELALDRQQVIDLKLANQDEALYRQLLVAQCHQLHQFMPFLFEPLDDETELLLPDNLTRTDSLIRALVDDVPADDWQNIEIIGWLYQFYISEKKDQVIGKVVKSEDIPAATQLFTPNWIVQYLVHNSIGRQWMLSYPQSPLANHMPYFIPSTQQPEAAQAVLNQLTPSQLDPEQLKVLDPACGSGHILVEAYNTLKAIYEERGYRLRDIPQLILERNIFGLDLDDRAAQLAAFALMMKAREDDRRIFSRDIQLNIYALQSTEHLSDNKLWRALNLNQAWSQGLNDQLFEQDQIEIDTNDAQYALIKRLVEGFEQAKTLGSLIEVAQADLAALTEIATTLKRLAEQGDTQQKPAAKHLLPIVQQAIVLAQTFDAVIANPPYMGKLSKLAVLDKFTKNNYPNSKSDLFAIFIERGLKWLEPQGFNAMVTMQSWMFLSSYEKMRAAILENNTVLSMAHLGTRAFDSIGGEVVSTTAFVLQKEFIPSYQGAYFRLVDGKSELEKSEMFKGSITNPKTH